MQEKIGAKDKISFVLNGEPIERQVVEPIVPKQNIPRTLGELIEQEKLRDQQRKQ